MHLMFTEDKQDEETDCLRLDANHAIGRQAYLHAQQEDRRGRDHQVGTPGTLLPRRQVLQTPRHHQEALRHPPHPAPRQAH
ncbi:hypothetical protein Golomagni_06271, partial [Golovinomyces magnicellulatus]